MSDESATTPAHAAYAVVVATVAMAVIGALGLWAGEAWLFPSLGPTIFLQAVTPDQPGARAWNTLAGHAIGVAAGFAALFLFGAEHAPPAMSADLLTASRIGATALAVGGTIGLQYGLRALHPPAAATTMLITLGGFKPGWHTVWLIAAGVVLVTVLGESARRWHPAQVAPRDAPTADPRPTAPDG